MGPTHATPSLNIAKGASASRFPAWNMKYVTILPMGIFVRRDSTALGIIGVKQPNLPPAPSMSIARYRTPVCTVAA